MFKLKTTCNFESVLKTTLDGTTPKSGIEQPLNKVGYIRGDYDGHRWWCQYFACNEHLKTVSVKAEIDKVGAYLIEDLLKDGLSAIYKLCAAHPEARSDDREYNFFMNGDKCNYWIKLINRYKDYNIYVHIFSCTRIRA